MERINGHDTVDIGGGKRGFRSQNALAGVNGTEVTDAFLNAVQEEICTVIEKAGIVLDTQKNDQLHEALMRIVAPGFGNRVAWMPVVSVTITVPPTNATLGDTYVIPAGATGAWAGQAQKLAEWNGSSWNIIATKDGHGVSLPDGRVFERISGSYVEKIAQDAQSGKWNYVAAAGTPNTITGTLTPAIAAYPTGLEVQVKIAAPNTGPVTLDLGGGAKAITTPSGSPLQSADLSAGGVYSFIYNGSNWVCLVEGQRVLDGNVTLYVRPDGSDSNDGSANTAAKAFRTIQRAINVAQRRYISASYTVTINCATGAYQPFEMVGGSSTLIEVVGDVTTPANCTVTATGTMACVRAFMNSSLRVKGFKLSGGNYLFLADDRSTISFEAIEFGSCEYYQIFAVNNSTINVTGNISCSGVARSMFVASANGVINCVTRTITFKAATSFSVGTCWANNGTIILTNATFTGGGNVAGSRYQSDITGVIFTAGAGVNFIPGTIAGAVNTGGNYL